MQTFDVSLCFVKNVLNIRRGARKDFFKFKVKFGECCVNGIIRMLERSLQGKKSTVNLVGMLVKILHSSLDLSSLFIPYLDCCPLKHRAYSSQGKSAKEAKQEQMGRETVCLEADKCVFSITCRWTVYVVHSDQILERQVLNLVFTCFFFVLEKQNVGLTSLRREKPQHVVMPCCPQTELCRTAYGAKSALFQLIYFVPLKVIATNERHLIVLCYYLYSISICRISCDLFPKLAHLYFHDSETSLFHFSFRVVFSSSFSLYAESLRCRCLP